MVVEKIITQPRVTPEKATLLFGELLVNKGMLSHADLMNALSEQKMSGGRLGEVLISQSLLNDEQVTEALAEHLQIEYIRFDDMSKINMEVARKLPEAIAKRFSTIIVEEDVDRAVVAMADPLNVIAIDTISLKLRKQIRVKISSPVQIKKAIEAVYHGNDLEEQQIRDLVGSSEVDVMADMDDEKLEDIAGTDLSSEADASKVPVIRFVDLLLSQAVKNRASDIHVEPQEKTMIIRMRVDGELRDMVPPPRKMQAAAVTRIKILAGMNIAERRLPQDGRFKIKMSNKNIDVRVNVIPTIYGEKVVMRILDSSSANHNLEALGFEPYLLKEVKQVLAQPHGIIIVTGPTGSGKSTTLYSTLGYLKDPTVNITTVEDPVEYRMAGVNQIQVRSEINLTFASCLRAILRQDPDIILVGEIRDKETVEIAIQAALTGHLVLSTFHTNDAPSAISRLHYMGIESYLLASTLNLIIAQRLIKRICEKCKEEVVLNPAILKRLKIDEATAASTKFYHGKGCSQCGGTGYYGRLPVFEFLVVDNDLREAIVRKANEAEIRDITRRKGYGGLMESGIIKMTAGLTTAEEVLGVTFAESIKEE